MGNPLTPARDLEPSGRPTRERRERRCARFEVDTRGTGAEADRVVPAGEHEEVEQLGIGECGAQPREQLVVDVARVVEAVDRLDQQALGGIVPTVVAGVPDVSDRTCSCESPTASAKNAT